MDRRRLVCARIVEDEVNVEIRLQSPAVSDVHRLERIPVYKSLSAAPTGEAPPTEETVSFLKEQQWALDFATELAQAGDRR